MSVSTRARPQAAPMPDAAPPLRLLFLYNTCFENEIASYHRGDIAAHRLIGYADAAALGQTALHYTIPRPLRWLLAKPLCWRTFQTLCAIVRPGRFDCAIATHEAAALPILLARRLGLLRRPVIVLALSLLHPRECRGIRKWLWRRLLPAADAVIAVFKPQIPWLVEEYGLNSDRIEFVPVGVDCDFFRPDPYAASEPNTCLAAGTQSGRDLPTLVRALPPGAKLRLIVTPQLAESIRGLAPPGADIEILDYVPMPQLREHYRKAAVHVCPLVETRFGSSHTVLVENMAMGKTLIVSDVSGVRDYVEHDVTALLVPPGDAEQLRETIRAVLENPARYRHLGENAARTARTRHAGPTIVGRWIEIAQRLRHRAAKPALPLRARFAFRSARVTTPLNTPRTDLNAWMRLSSTPSTPSNAPPPPRPSGRPS
jgi:glycosyltransferase involved in cell wall biosynthesis